MLSELKAFVSRSLNLHAMRKHRSRLGWRTAPKYSQYLQRSRSESGLSENLQPPLSDAVSSLHSDGVASFQTSETASVAEAMSKRIAQRESAGETVWQPLNEFGGRNYAGDLWRDFPELEKLFRGDLGTFLKGYFQTPFKLFLGTMYRSEALPDGRHGSQLWHSDGGPGTCVNVMFYLHELGPNHGALEALPWDQSISIFEREPNPAKLGASKRDVLTKFYESEIESKYRSNVIRPLGGPGLVVPFLNNTIHRGGFPAPGLVRTAMVFHCYPSHKPTNFDRYRDRGIVKTAPYPTDPSAEF